MSGRSINEARRIAILMGYSTYTGSPHSKCSTSERYVAGSACVHCARVLAAEQRDALKVLQYQARVDASDTNDADAIDEMFGEPPPVEILPATLPVKEQSPLVKDLLSRLSGTVKNSPPRVNADDEDSRPYRPQGVKIV
jgi:hypothetical protein